MANKLVVSESARRYVRQWQQAQKEAKESNPRHRVLVDPIMESMAPDSQSRILRAAYGEQAEHLLSSAANLREVDPEKIAEVIEQFDSHVPGGAGGLGIIGETLARAAVERGGLDGFGMLRVSLLHEARRVQSFTDGRRQRITEVTTDPLADPTLKYLGNDFVSINFGSGHDGEKWVRNATPVEVWLYTGFLNNDVSPLLDLRLRLPEVTGVMYPHFHSQANFDQMHVLGQGGFRLAQYLGVLGAENALGDLVIGHDGHTALFKFNLFLYFYNKFKGNDEAALAATRKLCAATIHAPQVSTVPRTTGDMVRRHYQQDEEACYGCFAFDNGRSSNALFAEMRLSKISGVVSPVHLLVTQAEEKAAARGFASPHKLLPDGVQADRLGMFHDAISMTDWLGVAVQGVLDRHFSFWRNDPQALGDRKLIGAATRNHAFIGELTEAFSIQDRLLRHLMNSKFARVFNVEIPDNAILLGSMRRATTYKINLTTAFLRRHEAIEQMAQEMNRPIFWLFAGMAHQADGEAIEGLQRLLDLLGTINKSGPMFQADFMLGYERKRAGFVFPGFAMAGCWVACTNPIQEGRSQGSEAFGPSAAKATANGAWLLGPDDGGAGCLADARIPTVQLYGPTTFIGKVSLHNDLWGNRTRLAQATQTLGNDFLGGLKAVVGAMDEDLQAFEAGEGHFAPNMPMKIRAMFKMIANYGGHILTDAYLEQTRG